VPQGIVEGVVVPPGNDGNVKDSIGTETGTVKKPRVPKKMREEA
jgi:hypothetical protein